MSKHRLWMPHEIDVLIQFYPELKAVDLAEMFKRPVGQVYAKAHALGLTKSDSFLAADKSGRIRKGKTDPRMQATQFKPGLKPWNSGMKGLQFEGSKPTQFKKGQRTGKAAENWVPLGSLRVNGDGYLDRKTAERGHGRWNWTPVHRLVWIEANGPIPDGHLIVFKPGRKTTQLEAITADILECISRAENARRNHPRTKSPELGRLIAMKSAITRHVRRIEREAEEAARTQESQK